MSLITQLMANIFKGKKRFCAVVIILFMWIVCVRVYYVFLPNRSMLNNQIKGLYTKYLYFSYYCLIFNLILLIIITIYLSEGKYCLRQKVKTSHILIRTASTR